MTYSGSSSWVVVSKGVSDSVWMKVCVSVGISAADASSVEGGQCWSADMPSGIERRRKFGRMRSAIG
jgi:hypothetical protein